MRAILQRTQAASVTVDGQTTASISHGMLILLGVTPSDTEEDIQWLAKKIANLRIYNDEAGLMNRSLIDVGGDAIVVSQFTLFASTKKGNRPSYLGAARPEQAEPMYERFVEALEKHLGKKVGKGIFGADMKVSLLNDGPVTIWIDTQNKE